MPTIALFGGTFDPIHLGHLAIAEGVLSRGLAGRVVFVPAFIPPHKDGRTITDARLRYRMVEAAIAGRPEFGITDFELTKRTKSFTIETLGHYRAILPAGKLAFVMGGDSAAEITTWREYERILSEYVTIVVTRPGVELGPFVALIGWLGFTATGPGGYVHPSGSSVTVVEDIRYDVSSTLIRTMVREGRDVSALVPPAARAIIESEGLYR